MTFLLIILFAITSLLAFIEERLNWRSKVIILVLYAITMIGMATGKDIESTADASSYEVLFNHSDIETEKIETSFGFISNFIANHGGTITTLFLVYALIAIPIKISAISLLTKDVFTALLIYIPVYFELHDLVQIRAAAAAAFLLTAIYTVSNHKYLATIGLFIAACFMHKSAFIFAPILLWGNRDLRTPYRWGLVALIPIGLIIYLKRTDFLLTLSLSLGIDKLTYYYESAQAGTLWTDIIIPYKNLFLLTKCAILCIGIWGYDTLKEYNKYTPIILLSMGCSIFVYMAMATAPVIATRLSDLLGIVDCIGFALLPGIIKPRFLTKIGILSIGTYMLIYNMFNANYFNQ